MPNNDFRLVACDSLVAKRAMVPLYLPKASTAAGRLGLRYEKRVRAQLQRHVAEGHFTSLEHNPWFTFSDIYGASACSPDFLLWLAEGRIIVAEVKLTWTPSAVAKLVELYLPVVGTALGVPTYPLVIVRNLTPDAPPAAHTITDALRSQSKLLHHFDNGSIIW